jgi:hypothetical protein
MVRCVVWLKITEVSEVLVASSIRALIILVMEAVDMSVNLYQTRWCSIQKTVIFILATVRN